MDEVKLSLTHYKETGKTCCSVPSFPFLSTYVPILFMSSLIPFITLIFLPVSWSQKSSLHLFPSPFKNSEFIYEVQIRFKFQSSVSCMALTSTAVTHMLQIL